MTFISMLLATLICKTYAVSFRLYVDQNRLGLEHSISFFVVNILRSLFIHKPVGNIPQMAMFKTSTLFNLMFYCNIIGFYSYKIIQKLFSIMTVQFHLNISIKTAYRVLTKLYRNDPWVVPYKCSSNGYYWHIK